RLLPHRGLFRIDAGRGGAPHFIERFGHAYFPLPQQVDGPVVRDAEQPGPQWRRRIEPGERRHRIGEGDLHHVFTVQYRTHEPRAVAMQLGTQRAGERDELLLHQAAMSSSTVMPLSPFNPTARAFSYAGSVSTVTTLSPKSCGVTP